MPTTVVLADDHAMFRKGLRLLLDAEEDILVVGEAGDGQEAIEKVRELAPDVVVMDISMPGLNGIEATEAIISEFPGIRVVALSIQSSKRFINEMLRAGAAGYILKESAPEELIDGIKSVIRGDVFLSAAVTKTLVTELIEKDPEPQPASPGGGISADTGYEIPLLRTKLQRPYAPPDLVVRSHLLDRLDEMRRRPLTLVSAMAGCGKSTLASQWLTVFKGHGFWLSLDKDDNDLHLFLGYIVAAIRTELPTACEATSALLATTAVPPIEVIGRHFLNDLDEIGEPCILVLDDYHNIRNKAVHDLISALLLHPPRHLHLMLLCRRDPPLPISSLRGRGQVNEFGISDLRFTQAETTAYLQKRIAFPLDETRAATIYEKIEGWPAGIRLLSQSLMQHADPDDLIRGLTGGIASISEYLLAEVLQRQPPAMAKFMVVTSLLHRFCAPLCESLLNTGDTSHADKIGGAEFIAWMQRENLFLIPLDTENRWYRYHHLFQDLLHNQLKRRSSPDEIATFHSRAGEWFESQRLISEAIDHAIAAGDVSAAARLFERNRYAELDADRWYVVENWLGRLPAEIKSQRPGLLLAEAWVAFFRHRLERVPSILEKVESLLGDQAAVPSYLGELDYFRGYLCYWDGEGEKSLQFFKQALRQIPGNQQLIPGEARLHLALARCMTDQKLLAIEELTAEIHSAFPTNYVYLTRLVGGLVFIHLISGDLGQAGIEVLPMQDLAARGTIRNTGAWALYLRAIAHLHSHELVSAANYFILAVKEQYVLEVRAAIDAYCGLALAQQLSRQPDDAAKTIGRMLEFAQILDDPYCLSIAHSCQARLALLQGDLSVATRWAQSFLPSPSSAELFLWLEVPVITRLRVLVAVGSEAELREATEQIVAIREQSENLRYTCQTIEIAVLQASALEKQGRIDDALAVLEEIVALAVPLGWIRPFVEGGQPIAGLLKRLKVKKVAVGHIEKLLAAFNVNVSDVPAKILSQPADKPIQAMRTSNPSQPLVEPLTNREIDVLELLAERLQNKEIADKLFVATETVKAHLKNIYQKLGVSKRREAVSRAIELGILSE